MSMGAIKEADRDDRRKRERRSKNKGSWRGWRMVKRTKLQDR